MTPGIVLLVLVACLVAMLPVWRLRVAGWPARWLLAAWLVYAIGIILAVRFAGGFRFLLPILVLAYVAPFVAGPERLARVLRGRRREEPVVIDVTPKAAPRLPEPPGPDAAGAGPGDDDRVDNTDGGGDDASADDSADDSAAGGAHGDPR